MLYSGRYHPQWARWSIMAAPVVRFQHADGQSRWIGEPPAALRQVRFTHDPLRDLDAVLAATRSSTATLGGWIGYLSYDLGRMIEPRAQATGGAKDDRGWPLIDIGWCPQPHVFDHGTQKWNQVPPCDDEPASPDAFALEPFHPLCTRAEYMAKVSAAKEYIAAGDIFQANIAQRFTAAFRGSARMLGSRAMATAQPWFGAYLESGDATVISLSPELFLHVDARTRSVISRPIKGTRPSGAAAEGLMRSDKDAAELHMIVDLMRNDLGRVCEFGTVHVPSARTIETHPTVHHGVGEVRGVLRNDVSIAQLLAATCPGGSVTGAPKIRAMQIIDELEPARRGPYCGAIGMFNDDGGMTLSIAIRTLLVRGNAVDYWAGAGIVADSDPEAEYFETLDKSAVIADLSTHMGNGVTPSSA